MKDVKLTSTDGGSTWTAAGANISAYALTVNDAGTVYATTPGGVLFSVDGAATFAPVADAPALYLLAASPDHLSRRTSADAAATWTEVGSAFGQAQAVAITSSGEIAVADDSGVRLLSGDQ